MESMSVNVYFEKLIYRIQSNMKETRPEKNISTTIKKKTARHKTQTETECFADVFLYFLHFEIEFNKTKSRKKCSKLFVLLHLKDWGVKTAKIVGDSQPLRSSKSTVLRLKM